MDKRIFYKDGVFHIFTRSIAEYKIFKDNNDYLRFIEMLKFYQYKRNCSFSYYLKTKEIPQKNLDKIGEKIIRIISYCLMPTHIHLILSSEVEDGITKFMKNLLDSYTRYFNTKTKRKGPLWESRFKSVLLETDEQLFHLTRYIHLNPVTAYLINKPEEWQYSAYSEYLDSIKQEKKICEYDNLLEINPEKYREFVENRISYKRELAKIKKIVFD
ncbi:MAG TPA: transposase [bacterium]|nr:transposase [bacterium]